MCPRSGYLGLSAIFASGLSSSTTLPARDGSTYETFYGLGQAPFTLSPDPRFLFLSQSHDAAIRRILQSLRRSERFIVLSGDIGTGKTTLCHALVAQFDRTTVSSLILNPFLSVDELLRQILVDFGVVSREGLQSERLAAASTHELSLALGHFLQGLTTLGGNAVVIVDEAQHLSPRVLEQLRVISSLGGQDSRPLQMVLVGQPNLLETLAAADLRQLDQRISLRAMLKPLERDDVERYIAHRLTVAGESVSVMFEKAAVKRVHALSGGVPRVINLICDRALMAGAERGVHEISAALVGPTHDGAAVRSAPRRSRRSRGRMVRRAMGATALVASLAAAALVAPVHRLVRAATPSPPPAPPPTFVWPAAAAVPATDLLKPGELLPPPAPPRRRPETPNDFVAGGALATNGDP